jgi:AcrR family transcriptional regulator
VFTPHYRSLGRDKVPPACEPLRAPLYLTCAATYDDARFTVSPKADLPPSTNSRLLQTAAELFWEKGFAGTSTRELSERLGIQKASLYYHIRSKDDLLFDISIRSLDEIQQAVMSAVASASSEGRLRAMVHAHLVTALTARDMHATMLTEMRAMSADRRVAVLARRDTYERTIVEIIKAEQEAGRLRADLNAHSLSLALLNLLNWTIFWYRPDGQQTIAELADFFCDIYLYGVSTERG